MKLEATAIERQTAPAYLGSRSSMMRIKSMDSLHLAPTRPVPCTARESAVIYSDDGLLVFALPLVIPEHTDDEVEGGVAETTELRVQVVLQERAQKSTASLEELLEKTRLYGDAPFRRLLAMPAAGTEELDVAAQLETTIKLVHPIVALAELVARDGCGLMLSLALSPTDHLRARLEISNVEVRLVNGQGVQRFMSVEPMVRLADPLCLEGGETCNFGFRVACSSDRPADFSLYDLRIEAIVTGLYQGGCVQFNLELSFDPSRYFGSDAAPEGIIFAVKSPREDDILVNQPFTLELQLRNHTDEERDLTVVFPVDLQPNAILSLDPEVYVGRIPPGGCRTFYAKMLAPRDGLQVLGGVQAIDDANRRYELQQPLELLVNKP